MDIDANCLNCKQRLNHGDLVVPVQKVIGRSGQGLWAEVTEGRAWVHLHCPDSETTGAKQ